MVQIYSRRSNIRYELQYIILKKRTWCMIELIPWSEIVLLHRCQIMRLMNETPSQFTMPTGSKHVFGPPNSPLLTQQTAYHWAIVTDKWITEYTIINYKEWHYTCYTFYTFWQIFIQHDLELHVKSWLCNIDILTCFWHIVTCFVIACLS